jgi:hypothetical protein
MKALFGGLTAALLGVLVLLPVGAQPGALKAEGIGFRNDLPIPIIVQGTSLVNKMLRRGQPLLILPGKTAWDINLPAGLRFVTIHDANQPNRILYRDPPIPFKGRDLFFGVKPAPVLNRVILLAEPVPN